jgi:hypothetical protein
LRLSALKAVKPVAEEDESLANSRKSLKFSTSQSVVRVARMLQSLVASMAVEQLGDLRE